jgi:hypothetical protein
VSNRQQRRREAANTRRIKQRVNRGPHQRDQIVRDARKVYAAVFDSLAGGIIVVEHAGCLYHTAALIYAAHQHGVDLMLQAGTAAWPRMPIEDDDGEVHTHFAYEWQGLTDPATQKTIAAGIMPEMHVWAAHIEEGALIDITTRYLPKQCRMQGGMEWLAEAPPDYLWAPGKEIPDAWLYTPHEDAVRFVMDEMKEAIKACGRVLGGGLP